ncbi:MAG: discoidin domain-containing protein, partial [Bacteroidaceae bacterium]|nr:discoidin domain-containing protein [Bacteroidaceae bacterium]
GQNAIPFDLVIDLNGLSTLDKLHYLGREDSGNGTITKATISYSTNKEAWSEPVAVEWARTPDTKEFTFDGNPKARYIKISVTKALGNYGSGRELYIFKVAGTESYIPGDINNDKKIDENDLTSYMNYTGLRKSDSDFDYISKGDINRNGLIDAFDISAVATCLNDGVNGYNDGKIGGKVTSSADKKSYKAGETVEISVKGDSLTGVNALSFSLPYSTSDYEYVEIQFPEEGMGVEKMENLSKNRLHTNGTTALYPTFVNLGEKAKVNGNGTLFKIVMKAKRNVKFDLKATDGIIADKFLNTINF